MRILTALLLLLCVDAQAGSIIKCRGADGSITFADTRCPADQQQLSKKTYRQRPIDTRGDLKHLQNGSEFPAGDPATATQPQPLFTARFADALAATQAIRLSLIEYYYVNGEWPASFEDLGLSSRQMTSSTIQQGHLLENGRLVFTLIEAFGENKRIVLAPNEVMSGTRIEWRCFSNFPAEMLISPMGGQLCESRYF